MNKYRIKNNLRTHDTQWSVMVPDKIRACNLPQDNYHSMDSMVWIIEGDPGGIGVCFDCLCIIHKKNLYHMNYRKVNIKKAEEEGNKDITLWSLDAIDEEIFECEQTMIHEYTEESRGRKILTKYWQKLQDIRENIREKETNNGN